MNIFCDGGVIGPNPSPLGGTWAFSWEDESKQSAGVITPDDLDVAKITNNQTELLAAVKALSSVSEGWKGTLFTDSMITMYRLTTSDSFKNIPNWLRLKTLKLRRLLRPKVVLIGGHPTKEELAIGKLKRNGFPTHRLNVWCDEECNRLAKWYKEKIYGR